MANSNQETIYEALGGAGGVRKLVEAFYPIVLENELLSPHFAQSDIEDVIEKQYLFLTQFFGGPFLYSDRYGHPMMRARHMHIPLTPELAEAWLSCMGQALNRTGVPSPLREAVLERLSAPAYHFINTPSKE
ncbi:globin domain-containing protein [Paenibacillus gansuensis]|uniref:Globin n=1 Tax=Paenibacillus gansuensis TaxID=306542 RepID=A0ABW5PEI1_9BACL